MTRPSVIGPVYKSIVRATSDMITDLNAESKYGLITYHNWEERALEEQLPANTLIGVDGFGFKENEGMWIIRYALAISSFRDINLLSEIDLLNEVQQKLGEGEKVDLLDLTTGTAVSQLVVADFEMLPMGQSELRNYRTIGLVLHRTSV